MNTIKLKKHLQIWKIAKVNLKHNFIVHFIISVVIILLTPVLFGTSDLCTTASAVPLEIFVSLIGIVLLTPVFQPEQNSEIEEVVTCKYVSSISVPDLAFTRMISNEENRMGRNLPINSLLILSTLQTQRRASLHELADTIHISEPRTKANVERLLESGLVEARGTGRGRIYILSAKVYKEQANAVGYVRQTGIDKLKYDELVLKLVKEQGYATRKDVSELLGISGDQAYRILRGLVDRKCLLLSGKGRGAKYLERQK